MKRYVFVVTLMVPEDHEAPTASTIDAGIAMVLDKDESSYVEEAEYGLLAKHEDDCPMKDNQLPCCGGMPV